MNLIDAYVTKLLSIPFFQFGKWWVTVEYNAFGVTSQTDLMFNTKEGAEQVEIGYKFLS